MAVWNTLEPIPEAFRGGAVTIGNFDGVHIGHASLVRKLKSHGLPTVAFTFDPHPARILFPDKAPERLTWTRRKVRLLEACGVDLVVVCPTTRTILDWTAETFFQRILCGTLDAKCVVEGNNFHFGKGREGDNALLRQYCVARGMEMETIDSVFLDGTVVSSSRIRKLLQAGNVADARRMLARPYRIRGTVVHGMARGRTLHFPTANLEGIDTLLPADGVYACRALVGDETYSAALFIGPNVTFHEQARKVEAHLLDFHGNLYDREMKLDFLARIRGLMPFDTPEQLAEQIRKDVAAIRLYPENGVQLMVNG